MTGSDRRSPGEDGPARAEPAAAPPMSSDPSPEPRSGIDDQTDPFIPRVTDTALSECHTDPTLSRVGAALPADAGVQGVDGPPAADSSRIGAGASAAEQPVTAAAASSDPRASEHLSADFEDTDVHAVVGLAPAAIAGAQGAAETTNDIVAVRAEPASEATTGRQADGGSAAPTDQREPVPAEASAWAAGGSGVPVGLHPHDLDLIDADPADAEQHDPTASAPQDEQSAWWRRRRVLVPLGVLGLLLGLYAMDLLVAGNDVPRNTVVAGMHLGGLSRDQAVEVLQDQGQAVLAVPRSATAGPVKLTVSPAEAGLALDVPGTVEAAIAQPLHPFTRLMSLFADRRVDAVLHVDQPALDEAMTEYADQVDVAFVEGSIRFEGTTPSVVVPSDGRQLDRAAAARALQAVVRTGSDELVFPVREQKTQVTVAEAEQTLESFVVPAVSAPVLLTGSGETETELTIEEIAAALRFGPGDDGSLLAWVDEAGLNAGIGADAARFVTPPVDASFDVSGASVSVIPSVDGTAVDAAALAQDLMRVLRLPAPRQSAVPVMIAQPALSTDEARTLNIADAVSTFTSTYDDAAVAQNIKIVAETVNGAVIRPGQTYSLNAGTGPRTADQGYVPAAGPAEGAPAMGEGVSPFATAMYNAVFFAGLEDVRHTPHPSYDDTYPAGRDATVRYDSADLVWRNDSTNGVFVQTRWQPTAVTVTFWSTVLFDIEAVNGSQSNLREPATEVGAGAGCRTSSGSTGFDISVVRVFKRPVTGEVLREEQLSTSYAPAPRVRCEGAPEPPAVTEPPPPESPVVVDPPDPPAPIPPAPRPTQTSTSAGPPPPPPTTPPTTSPTTNPPPTTDPPPTTEPPPTINAAGATASTSAESAHTSSGARPY